MFKYGNFEGKSKYAISSELRGQWQRFVFAKLDFKNSVKY